MASLNDPNNFAGRVSRAASHMAQGRPITRGLDNCFENHDGDAVAVALYRRAQKNPEGQLARNIWRYLNQTDTEALAAAHAHRTDLLAWSRDLVAASRARWQAMREEQLARNAAQAAKVDLTPAGEQFVIPGCERVAPPSQKQLTLW